MISTAYIDYPHRKTVTLSSIPDIVFFTVADGFLIFAIPKGQKSAFTYLYSGLPWWLSQLRICLQCRRPRFNPWVGKIPWKRKWQPTPVFLPGKFYNTGAWRATLHGITGVGHKRLTKPPPPTVVLKVEVLVT